MENTMEPIEEYLCSLIGMSCEKECDAINIADSICELATTIHKPSFIEKTKMSWHQWQEQPMLEHYGMSDKIKEYSHE